MPPGIVDYDHIEAVNALAQGNVTMITEWSSFYTTLADPRSSSIVECLAVAPEPSGPERRVAALGGFSLGVNAASSDAEQAAAWLFVQWITSAAKARAYVEAGGVSARKSVYEIPEIRSTYPFVAPMVASWQDGIPHFRPRFPDWPEISEHIAEVGSRLMLHDLTVEEAAQILNERLEHILERSGYYSGQKSLLQ
jgi:multiple sugar transport system substrate-binding protein